MNYLSTKLSKAISNPTFIDQRRSVSLNPSAASIKFLDVSGNEKVIGACHRQSYYKMTGVLPDDSTVTNPDWTLAAIMGDKLHQMLAELLDKYGFAMGIHKLSEEHSIYNDLINLSGRTDMLAWDYNHNEPIGIEVKSISEYKCKIAVEQPVEEHVLQSVVYLDYYNKTIPSNQKKITKWYLWYLARSENWTIKSKPHSSPFAVLWDYCIELSDGVPIIHMPNGVSQRWSQFSVEEIYKRYTALSDAIKNQQVPSRDYELTYSEEKILALHKADKISRKTDRDTIDKWVKKGAPPGKLSVTLGDGECMFCEYSKLCWEGIKAKQQKSFSNLPVNKTVIIPEKGKDKTEFFL